MLTLLKAAAVLGDPGGRYVAAATAAADDIWARGLLRKVGLSACLSAMMMLGNGSARLPAAGLLHAL